SRSSAFADDLLPARRLRLVCFVQRTRITRLLVELAAMGAAGNLARADKGSPLVTRQVRNAMAGLPDAVVSRAGMTRDSFSPSCSWLWGFADKHERKKNVRYASS